MAYNLLNFDPTNGRRNGRFDIQRNIEVVFLQIDGLAKESIYLGRRSLLILFWTSSKSYEKREKVDGYEDIC